MAQDDPPGTEDCVVCGHNDDPGLPNIRANQALAFPDNESFEVAAGNGIDPHEG